MTQRVLLITLLLILLPACKSNSEAIQPTSTLTFVPSPTITSTLTPAVAVFPTSELSPYYGEPEPIQIIFDGKTYQSEIGSTMWITEVKPDGTTVGEIGDAFAIITPKEPIQMITNPSFILKLLIPISPIELWYAVFPVTENEINLQDPKEEIYRWQPNYKEQPQLPLLAEQKLSLPLKPGMYVLEVHAGWGGTPPHTELEADYGFLLKVTE